MWFRSKLAESAPPAPRTAVVTGASAGIGRAFAEQLAERGYDLILVARRAERLSELGARLQERFHVRAEAFPADLACDADVDRLARRIEEVNRVEVLVNNAGFGVSGLFYETDAEKNAAMIRVHVLAAVRLARAVLPQMIARNRGCVINVSSLASFIAAPGAVSYCATKTYLNCFSKALQYELGHTAVRIQALCPGFTYSEFHDLPDAKMDRRQIPGWLWMSSDKVARISLDAIGRRGVVCVPGWVNWCLSWLLRSQILTPLLWLGYGRGLKRIRSNG